MVSNKEIEAALSAFLAEYGDSSAEWWHYRKEVIAALEAAARVREEENAEGGKPSLSDITASLGYRVPDPAPQPSGTVAALADALRGVLKAYENAFDWTAELPPETAEAERIANEVLEALTSSKPEQVPSGLVEVKPLEWEEARISDNWERFTADSLLGSYEAIEWPSGDFGGTLAGGQEFTAATMEEAKAAAQADYERRILSALTAGGV